MCGIKLLFANQQRQTLTGHDWLVSGTTKQIKCHKNPKTVCDMASLVLGHNRYDYVTDF